MKQLRHKGLLDVKEKEKNLEGTKNTIVVYISEIGRDDTSRI